MIEMVATAAHTYAGRALRVGDRFVVQDPRHVLVLVGLNRARTVQHYDELPEGKAIGAMTTADMNVPIENTYMTRDHNYGRANRATKRNKRQGA